MIYLYLVRVEQLHLVVRWFKWLQASQGPSRWNTRLSLYNNNNNNNNNRYICKIKVLNRLQAYETLNSFFNNSNNNRYTCNIKVIYRVQALGILAYPTTTTRTATTVTGIHATSKYQTGSRLMRHSIPSSTTATTTGIRTT